MYIFFLNKEGLLATKSVVINRHTRPIRRRTELLDRKSQSHMLPRFSGGLKGDCTAETVSRDPSGADVHLKGDSVPTQVLYSLGWHLMESQCGHVVLLGSEESLQANWSKFTSVQYLLPRIPYCTQVHLYRDLPVTYPCSFICRVCIQ